MYRNRYQKKYQKKYQNKYREKPTMSSLAKASQKIQSVSTKVNLKSTKKINFELQRLGKER